MRRHPAIRWPCLWLILGVALAAGLWLPGAVLAEDPSPASSIAPTLSELGLPRIASITAGLNHACLLGDDGSAWCWGDNSRGQLGLGVATQGQVWPPRRVTGLPGPIRAISAYEMATCALTEAGGAWCWGANDFGIVGDGTGVDRASPTAVVGMATGAVALSGGGLVTHVCAVKADGTAACWGGNSSGALGDGTALSRQGAVDVTVTTERFVAIVTSNRASTCALTAGGAVRCWGELWKDPQGATEGASAAAPDPARRVLTPLGLGAGVKDLAASQDSVCGLLGSGAVLCWSWGWDTPEQVASQPWAPGPVPEAVPGLPGGVESVRIFRDFFGAPQEGTGRLGSIRACVTAGGRAWCWGDNFQGAVGDGTTTNRPTPVEAQARDIAQLALGGNATFALLRDGSLVVWGDGNPATRPLVAAIAPPAATGFRSPGTLVPAITTHIPTPTDISSDPPVVEANLLLAAIAMLALTVATELLNRSLGELDPVLRRRLRPVGWIDRARERLDATLIAPLGGRHGRLADALRILGIAAFYGIVFALLDPTWNPLSVTGLWLVCIMAVAFGLIGLSGDIAAWATARRWGVAGDLAVRPGSLMVALASVAFSRVLVLVPGVMIGSPEALDVDADRLDRRRLGRLAGVGLGTVLAVGASAWLATLATAPIRSGAGVVADIAGGLEAFLLLVFAASVQDGFVQLLSVRESAGLALRRAYRIPWAIALLAVMFLFWHTLVNPRGDLAEAVGSTNVQAFLATVGVVLVAAIGMWAWTRARRGPAARGPVAASPAAGQSA